MPCGKVGAGRRRIDDERGAHGAEPHRGRGHRELVTESLVEEVSIDGMWGLLTVAAPSGWVSRGERAFDPTLSWHHRRSPCGKAVRRPALSLRHPQTVVPQEPGHRARRRGAGRSSRCRLGVAGGRCRRRRGAPPTPRRSRRRTCWCPGDPTTATSGLIEQFERGLDAPICLTWELTYACSLRRALLPSSSGRRDPRELSTQQCKSDHRRARAHAGVLCQHRHGEPTVRPDFHGNWSTTPRHTGSVVSSPPTASASPEVAARLAASDYVDADLPDGAPAEVNDAVRGVGLVRDGGAGFGNLAVQRVSRRRRVDDVAEGRGEEGAGNRRNLVVVTRHNVGQLDPRASDQAGPTGTAQPCGSPGCAPPAAGRRLGRTAPHPGL